MPGKVVRFPKRLAQNKQPVGFYAPADAARLARLPRHRLDSWRRLGLIPRDMVFIDFGGEEGEGYSFESLVYLRVLRMLRKYESLQSAVDTVRHLVDRFGAPGQAWADARLFQRGSRVYAIARDEWEVTDVERKNKAMHQVLFDEGFEQLRDRADALLVPHEFQDYIEIDPSVASGMPVVLGTRLQSAAVYELHNSDHSQRSIRREYPFLAPAQIKRAIDFELFLDYASKVA